MPGDRGLMATAPQGSGSVFHFVMIRPSHYDEDGYVIQWFRSAMPSNSLAVVNGIAADCAERQVLGPDVELRMHAYDESNTRIQPERLARMIRKDGGSGLIGLIGVQSNQYPRALDLARRFRALGLPVCIGGFHVSGVISMLKEPTPELREALDMGVSLFLGEAEGRLDIVLRDAYRGELKPIYNYLDDLPPLDDVPLPHLPAERVTRTMGAITSFDAGRGCPFQCSFCTIINVQGRKSRHRTPDDVERIVRANLDQGINRFFITDDNFARNRNWETIFDRLAKLRRIDKLDFKVFIQVDAMCHKLPNFIAKARKAGVSEVFIGLENINPDNLKSAKKRQNRIAEYRLMLHAWRKITTFTYAGYILGFPTDTPERMLHDIEIIKRELPIDLLEFHILTPLPGSEDHKNLHDRGVWMDPDLNKYDFIHVTTNHPLMSAQDLLRAYDQIWRTYYSPDHVQRLLRRARAGGMNPRPLASLLYWFHRSWVLEGMHPIDVGVWRRKYRKDRRPGLPIESPLTFYPRYVFGQVAKYVKAAPVAWQWRRYANQVIADPEAWKYRDVSLQPVKEAELSELDLYTDTAGGVAEIRKMMAQRRPAPAAAQ
jgi:radical SAM superfamily enzyme YgiQ (UPF0313 family)